MTRLSSLLCLSLALAGAIGTAAAQSAGRYAITRHVLAGGGGAASRTGAFAVSAALAQPVAADASGGRYAARSGFVTPGDSAPLPVAVFKDGFE